MFGLENGVIMSLSFHTNSILVRLNSSNDAYSIALIGTSSLPLLYLAVSFVLSLICSAIPTTSDYSGQSFNS